MTARKYSCVFGLATAMTLALSGCSLKDSIIEALEDEEDELEGGRSPLTSLIPSTAGWEILGDEADIRIGFGHTEFGLRAWIDDDSAPHITESAPDLQPTMAGTWTGEWGALIDAVPAKGEARVDVTIDASATEAVLHYDDVPGFGDLATGSMSVTDGGFEGTHTVTGADGPFQVRGQFGGQDQVGVVGYVQGQGLQSGFYGERE